MTLKQAQVRARELNIAGRSKMNKDQLIQAINMVEDRNLSGDSLANATPQEFGRYLGTKTKGEARKIRKLMRNRGLNHLAAAPRVVGEAQRAAA